MKKVFFILLIGMFLVGFGSASLTDNLISYFKLDEPSGTVVIDSTGNQNVTSIGLTVNEVGLIKKSYLFPSINGNYINADSLFDEYNIPSRSISMWFNATDTTPASAEQIFEHNGAGSNFGFTILQLNTNGSILFNLGGGIIYSSAISVGWHNAIVTRNSTTERIYLDGVLIGTQASGTSKTPSIDVLRFGDSRSLDSGFGGWQDEIALYNRTLDDDGCSVSATCGGEIEQLYNGGAGITYPFFSITTTSVTLDSPQDGILISLNVTFNATITPPLNFNLTNATLFVWDSNGNLFFSDTNNVTGNTLNTTTFIVSNLTTDNYEWNILGSSENTTGFLSANFSQFNNTFTWVPFFIDNEVFETDVFETSRQEFLINITTLSSVLSMDATLNYNGTEFTTETSCSVGLCEVSTAIDIPLVSTGESENKSFFWIISIFDGTNSFSTNITANEQNVTKLHLEKCNATFTIQTLNFTSFDETTEDIINPFMLDGTFNFWIGTGTVIRNNSISESSIASLQMCISPPSSTFFLNATIEYDETTGTNYTNRNYFFQNDTISNVSKDIRLGLLLAEDSTSFILKVQDRDILPVANVLIFIERFYPGDGVFKTVQVSETDDSGRTVGFFETETVDYRFILKQNGITVLTTNKQKIVGESVPFTLTFTIGVDEGAAWKTFEDVDDLTSDINFNKTSNIVSFVYVDTSGNFALGRLVVEKVNASALQNTIICSETSVESSAIITCNLTGNSTGQYIMRGIITRNSNPFLVQQEPFAIEDFSTISGRLGLFLGWFIILISVFAFKFNEVAGIILVNLAIIMVNLIGLIAFGYVFISAMIAISIIILVVLER